MIPRISISRVIILLLIILLLGSGVFGWWLYRRERQIRIRHQDNQTTLTQAVQHYKTKDSLNVARIGVLKLTNKEFKQATDTELTSLRDRVKTLDIRLKNIQSVATASTTTTGNFSGVIRDGGLVINNKFGDLHLTVNRDTIIGQFVIRDKMTQVVYKERRKGFGKLLFWKRRRLMQDITFENPNTIISYPRFIIITNRKGK